MKKAPRTASLAALETHCTDELSEAVSGHKKKNMFNPIFSSSDVEFCVCAFYVLVTRWQQIASRNEADSELKVLVEEMELERSCIFIKPLHFCILNRLFFNAFKAFLMLSSMLNFFCNAELQMSLLSSFIITLILLNLYDSMIKQLL